MEFISIVSMGRENGQVKGEQPTQGLEVWASDSEISVIWSFNLALDIQYRCNQP